MNSESINYGNSSDFMINSYNALAGHVVFTHRVKSIHESDCGHMLGQSDRKRSNRKIASAHQSEGLITR